MNKKVEYSCGCSSWFVRCLTWAIIAAAFGLSLAALYSCELLKGRVIYYEIFDDDIRIEDIPISGGTRAPLPQPRDPFLDPLRQVPIEQQSIRFTLGVYKFYETAEAFTCLEYGNNFYNQFLNDGPAEGSARFFGTLAATLGGISLIIFFGLAATELNKKFLLHIFSAVLLVTAFCQILIFTLNSSDHCDSGYWDDFLSVREQSLETRSAVSCEMGDGGWYAIIAIILYIFAALLVALKWSEPAFSMCTMEWTKEFSDDYPRERMITTTKKTISPPRQTNKNGADIENQHSSSPSSGSNNRKQYSTNLPQQQVPPTMETIENEMQPLVPDEESDNSVEEIVEEEVYYVNDSTVQDVTPPTTRVHDDDYYSSSDGDDYEEPDSMVHQEPPDTDDEAQPRTGEPSLIREYPMTTTEDDSGVHSRDP